MKTFVLFLFSSLALANPECTYEGAWEPLSGMSNDVQIVSGFSNDQGNLLIVGKDPNQDQDWIVQERDPNSGVWTETDRYDFQSANAQAGFSSGDNSFVAGSYDGSSFRQWMVRKRGTDGVWQTVDSYGIDETGQEFPTFPISGSAKNQTIAIVGQQYIDSRWVVRASHNAGQSWETILDFAKEDDHYIGKAVFVATEGTIYTAGYGDGASTEMPRLLLKKGIFDLTTSSWQWIDLLEKPGDIEPLNIEVDRITGAVYLTVYSPGGGGIYQSFDEGMTFTFFDSNQLQAEPVTATIVPGHPLYVTGRMFPNESPGVGTLQSDGTFTQLDDWFASAITGMSHTPNGDLFIFGNHFQNSSKVLGLACMGRSCEMPGMWACEGDSGEPGDGDPGAGEPQYPPDDGDGDVLPPGDDDGSLNPPGDDEPPADDDPPADDEPPVEE